MVSIKKDGLFIEVNELGAELWHLIKNGKEYLWQGDPTYWHGRAYNLFPICGGLKDDEYFYGGKAYHLNKHGFGRKSVYTVEYVKDDEISLLLSGEKLKDEGYPFLYEFRVVYKIINGNLEVSYKMKNIDNKEIYFSAGAHEGYMLYGDITDYSLAFPDDDELYRYLVDGNIVTFNREKLPVINHELHLNYDFFDIDAIILKEHKSRTVYLKNNVTNEKIKVDFADFPYLLIWTVRDGGYVCIEPWSGLPDNVNSTKKIEEKEGITSLKPNEEKVYKHTITL